LEKSWRLQKQSLYFDWRNQNAGAHEFGQLLKADDLQ
jgi:hypothetical protein